MMQIFFFVRHMFMHFHALHVFFLLSCALNIFVVFLFLSWHPKSLFLLKTQFIMVLLILLFLLILSSFVMRRHEMTFIRTFLIGQFIQKARSFCLIFYTLLYPMCLVLKDGLPFMSSPRGVSTCSYRSFTPTCMP